MDNFKVIYKILKVLDSTKGDERFDNVLISAEKLKIPYEQWESIVIMLQDEGYIKGVLTSQSLTQRYPHIADMNPQITLRGMEYLQENGMMKKAGEALKQAGEFIGLVGAFLPK